MSCLEKKCPLIFEARESSDIAPKVVHVHQPHHEITGFHRVHLFENVVV